MDSIYKAQDYIKDFLSKSILPTYKFNDWKESLVLSRTKQTDALHKKWNLFGAAFVPIWIEPDILSAGDWIPAIIFRYRWNINDSEILVRFSICNNLVVQVEIEDMFDVADHFGRGFDFVNEFEKVVLMYGLSKK